MRGNRFNDLMKLNHRKEKSNKQSNMSKLVIIASNIKIWNLKILQF